MITQPHSDYHKPINLSDVVIGLARDGQIWVKHYTRIGFVGRDIVSDYPHYQFPIETLGM